MSVPSAANAAHILIKGQATEFEIEQLVDTWKRDRPGDFRAFQAMVQAEHEALVAANGMSKDETLAYVGQIPADVYIVVARRYPEWLFSGANVRKLHAMCCGSRLPAHKEKNFFIIDRRTSK